MTSQTRAAARAVNRWQAFYPTSAEHAPIGTLARAAPRLTNSALSPSFVYKQAGRRPPWTRRPLRATRPRSGDDTGVVRRLMARGLVRRGLDPMDRRTVVPEPTVAGVALIGGVVASAGRAHEAALAPLAPEEQTQLLGLLRKMG